MTPGEMSYVDPVAPGSEWPNSTTIGVACSGGVRPPGLRSLGPRSLGWSRTACAAGLLGADLLAFLVAVGCAALLLRQDSAWQTASGTPILGLVETLLATGSVLLGGMMLFFARHGHYWRRVPFWYELRDMLLAGVLALIGFGFVQYLFQRHDSRLFVGLVWLVFPVAAMLLRQAARGMLDAAGVWELPIVVVARRDAAQQAEDVLLCERRLGYRVVGVIDPSPSSLRLSTPAWRSLLQRYRAHLMLLALDPTDGDAREMTESLVRARVPFAVMPRLDGLPVLGFERTCFFSHDTVMFSYRNNLARPLSRLTKILFDLVAAAILLTLAAPVLLLIALAVKRDGGPALFRHSRIGANGREFACLKFRSMVVDADPVLRRVLETDAQAAAEWAETRKLRRDPRVTWIGRILRATSLDELPQLLNVLRLEMSLVGPRPIVRSEVARYGEDISYYYEARPGVTGLWQVSGRSDTSYAQRIRLDTWYVKNWTIWHDLAILAKTLPAVLKRQGAV